MTVTRPTLKSLAVVYVGSRGHYAVESVIAHLQQHLSGRLTFRYEIFRLRYESSMIVYSALWRLHYGYFKEYERNYL